ncbi:hypothetical protein KL864_01170 [Mycolicibacterium goodii]|uniref:hypothetical protein n=1 Tax=Mycolicibacterium goodii TaxID=134601 RepID=UPI001BDCE6EE|nr:hypothetical protein [Mycolicibacterium goodii]MBU8814521.1 hypothetical protein [Mycolicibacterium goodii]
MNRKSIPCAEVVMVDSIVRGLRSRVPSQTGNSIVGIIAHLIAHGTVPVVKPTSPATTDRASGS